VNSPLKPSLRQRIVRWWNWLQASDHPGFNYMGGGKYSHCKRCRLGLEILEDRLPPGDTAGGILLPIMLFPAQQDPFSPAALLGEEGSATPSGGAGEAREAPSADAQAADLITLLSGAEGGRHSDTATQMETATPTTSGDAAPWGTGLSKDLGQLTALGIPLGLSEPTYTGQSGVADPSFLLARAPSGTGQDSGSVPGARPTAAAGSSPLSNPTQAPATNALRPETPNLLSPLQTLSTPHARAVKPGVTQEATDPVAGGRAMETPLAVTSSLTPQFAYSGVGGIVAARGTDETAPVANDDNYGVHPNITVTVTANIGLVANDTDADGDPIFATLVSGPTNGTLSLEDSGAFSYTPNAGFSGSDTFIYQASDGQLDGNTATVTLNVHASNSAPVANGASYSVVHDQPLNLPLVEGSVLENASDSDGDPLTASVVTGPAHGSLLPRQISSAPQRLQTLLLEE
jgi:VCBS repeat-containing protein